MATVWAQHSDTDIHRDRCMCICLTANTFCPASHQSASPLLSCIDFFAVSMFHPEMAIYDRTHEYHPPHSSLWLLFESPGKTRQRYPENQRFHWMSSEAFPVTALWRLTCFQEFGAWKRKRDRAASVFALRCLGWGQGSYFFHTSFLYPAKAVVQSEIHPIVHS